jgi:Signal transduction histidine kinase
VTALPSLWLDRALAVVSGAVMMVFALAYVTQPPVPDDRLAGLTLAGVVVAHAVLAVRSTHPRIAVVVAALGGATAAAAGFEAPVVALPFALYSLVVTAVDVWWPLGLTAGAVGLLTVARLVGTRSDVGGNLAVRDAAIVLAAVAVGAWARAHRRAGRQAVELEAAVRIAEQRLALSRELHDLAAGALTATAVQAGTAAHLSATAPDTARVMIAEVAEQSRAAMARLRSLAAALRSGDLPSPHPVAPTVDALVELYGRAGLAVHGSWVSAAGEQRAPVTVRLVVQEALTNVLRHAGSVDVDLSVEEVDGAWRVRVGNPVREPARHLDSADHRGGLGLVGLGERVTALGGTLTYGRRDGRFELTAVVPMAGAAR